MTDHMTDEEMIGHFHSYMRDQLVLDNEMEDARIRLSNERDFYPKVCFRTYLVTEESKAQKETDINDLRANSYTIFEFIKSQPRSDLGMIQLKDLEEFLTVVTKKQAPFELTYDDFMKIISPKAKDFTELMIQRQTDLDLQSLQVSYIDSILDQNDKQGTLGETQCR